MALANEKGPFPLQQSFSFWYAKRSTTPPQGQTSLEDYEQSIKLVGSFDTVEGFWAIYNHMIKPVDLNFNMEYYLFRAGVKPVWEDPENKNGGKFILRLNRSKSSKVLPRYWEDLLLALIGGQFDLPLEELCGIALTVRPTKDVISIWNKASGNDLIKKTINDTVRGVLRLPASVLLEYRSHALSSRVGQELNDSSQVKD